MYYVTSCKFPCVCRNVFACRNVCGNVSAPSETKTFPGNRVLRTVKVARTRLPQCLVGFDNAASTVSNSAILSNNYISLLSDRLSAHAYERENGVTNEA